MKSKALGRQQLHSAVRSLNTALVIVLVMFALSESSLAQSRLPFVGTRTFCGEHSYQLSDARDSDPKLKWKTKTTVTIRANGFTTVKTNAHGSHYGEKNEGTPSPYLTFSGKLTAGKKGEMHDTAMSVCMTSNPFCLTFLSTTHIIIDTENSGDEGELCTSEEAAPQKSSDVQRTPAAPGNAVSNPSPGVRAQSTSTPQIAPDALVANLYKQQVRVFQPRSRMLLDKYFEKSLADLIWMELLRWEKNGEEDGVFDNLLFNFSNGVIISKLVIGKSIYASQKAQVIVSYDESPDIARTKLRSKETIVFLLTAGETGWKISDIKYDCGFDWCVHGGKTSVVEMYSMDSKATAAEREFWESIPCCNNAQGYKDYLQKYPNGAYARVARAKISQLEGPKSTQPPRSSDDEQSANSGTPPSLPVSEPKVDPAAVELSYWESIRNSTDPEDFKAYLEKYPNGKFAELARSRVGQLARPASNPVPADVTAAERARNTHVFEVRDASKTSGWLTVAPGSVTFEPKKAQAGKNITIQCSEIKHIEQGQSTVATSHVNLFLNGKEVPLVFYTSSGGTGVVGVFVKGLPAKPVVDITANVIRGITEACKLTAPTAR